MTVAELLEVENTSIESVRIPLFQKTCSLSYGYQIVQKSGHVRIGFLEEW